MLMSSTKATFERGTERVVAMQAHYKSVLPLRAQDAGGSE